MNKNDIVRSFNIAGMKLKKYSPEILAVVGTVGVIAGVVSACKATTKLDGILEKSKEDIDTIHRCAENPEDLPEKYTVEDSKKDLAVVYAKTGVQIAKNYAPSVILITTSLGCLLTSNQILRKRNIALAAAYTAVDKGFKEYRARVVDRFGADLDRELRYDIKAKQIEETITDEKGKEKKVKKTVNEICPENLSDYAKFFGPGNDEWDSEHSEFNLSFLKARERYANDLLKSRGHLFLNEIYDMLGFERTRAGQIVGWVYDPSNPDTDSYVDFGIYTDHNIRFVNGVENVALLDFNVDGNVLDLM